MTTDAKLVKELRSLLDRLVRAERAPGDRQEVVYDEVAHQAKSLPRTAAVLEALDMAARDRHRGRHAHVILSELTDVPGALERVASRLESDSADERSALIQTIGLRKLVTLAAFLNPLIETDPDMFVRQMAIHAAGQLRSDINFPTLIRLSERCPDPLKWHTLWALKEFSRPECRTFLATAFLEDATPKAERTIAAWGLAKLGDERARDHLVEMLSDPDSELTKDGALVQYRPGESIRAAQALCDVMGWPFEWSKSSVKNTQDRWERSRIAR